MTEILGAVPLPHDTTRGWEESGNISLFFTGEGGSSLYYHLLPREDVMKVFILKYFI